jgi:hypothetical protein
MNRRDRFGLRRRPVESLIPMQPTPIAETSSPALPSLRFFIRTSFG